MNSVFAGAMIIIMALCVFGIAIPLGGVTSELASPGYTLAGLLLLLWAGSFIRTGSWVKSPLHLPIACFLLYATVRYFFCEIEYEARFELFQVWICALIYFCCASGFHRPADRKVFLVAMLILGVLESGYAIWQSITKAETVFIWERPASYGARASGTFIYPNHFAAFLGLILAMAIARLFLVRREKASTQGSVMLKLGVLYAAGMMVAGIVLTRSRGGWIAIGVGLIAFLILGEWRPSFTWRRLLYVVFAMLVVGFAAMNLDVVSDRVLGSFKTEHDQFTFRLGDRSLGGRTLMWKGSLEMIRDHPWFGTGQGSWQWIFQLYKPPSLDLLSRPEYAHNDFLNLACDYGLAGFVLVGWVFFSFFKQALALRRIDRPPEERAFAVGAAVAVGTLLAHCCFDFVCHIPANSVLLASLMGLTAAMEAPECGIRRTRLAAFPRIGLVLALLTAGVLFAVRFIPTAMACRYTDLGNRLKRELEYDVALAFYERSMELDPRFPEPPARIGDIHRTWAFWRVAPEKHEERRELARQAAAAYDRSLELNDRQSLVWSERGRVLLMADQEAEAVRSYERAIEVYPANAYPYFLLGCYYRDHGQPEKARELFRRAEQITPAYSAELNRWELENK